MQFWECQWACDGFCVVVCDLFVLLIYLLLAKLTGIRRLSAKNVKLVRPTLFNYIATADELAAASKELWNFIEKDKLNVRIHDVYPLEDVVRATKVSYKSPY